MCAADRVGDLNCTANDIEVARIEVLNGVTTCRAGEPVTLDLRAYLHVNAADRHDVGLFLAQDGRSPILPSTGGGSAMCAVYGLPKTPPPYADLDGNACGDFDRGSLPQGVETSLDLGTVTVTCKADAAGYLDIPTVITWRSSGGQCSVPAAAWVEPETKSKCESGVAARIEVQVLGRIVVTKQTVPDGAAGSFAFSATGTGVTPTSFSLSDGQSQTIATGPLGATAQAVTVTEQALGGWGPGAQILCTDSDGDIAPFVTVDNANRRFTANLTAAFSEAFCTVTNTQQASITITKTTQGGDGSFAFSGSAGIAPFTITTSGGSGQQVFSGLAPGQYSIAEAVPAGWDLSALSCVDPTSNSTVNLAGASVSIDLAAGESVNCTFTDTRRGSITVVKNSVGGDGVFNFAGPATANSPGGAFQIATSGGSGQVQLPDLAPGTYAVSEAVPAGWDLTALSCSDPSGGTTTNLGGASASIGLAAGENVTCTFTDTRRAAIVVLKQVAGADATFAYTGSQSFSITTSGGNGQNTAAFASVAPGTYTITEAALAGYTLSSLSCSDPSSDSSTNLGTRTASVVLAPGETVQCTFGNTQLASVTVIKHAVPHIAAPNTPQFAFTASGLTPSSFTLADDGTNPNSRVFTDLVPGGAYSVTETPFAGWPLTALTCSDQNDPNAGNRSSVNLGSGTATLNLQPGEALTCVFTNVRNDNGGIVVTKHTIGGGGSFAFTNSGGVSGSPTNPDAFTITTTTANPTGAQSLSGLAAGTYTITEAAQAGWDLGPIACVTTAGSSSSFSYTATSATVVLGTTAGNVDGVACSFTNTRRAGITIVKQATPSDAQDFTFTATGGNGVPANFLLDDDADPTLPNTRSFSDLPPGAYTFTEQATAGWTLTAIACSGGAAVTTNPATGLASIDLQAGEAVTCTFRNAKKGTISITKQAVGGSGGETFAFSGALAGNIGNGQSLSGSFDAGTYSVSELVPAGWDLSNIQCSGGSVTITGAGNGATSAFEPGDTTVNITLAAGDTVACTYTDTRRGAITVRKTAVGGDGVFAFAGSRSFQVQTSGGSGQDSVTYASVAPGTYTVTELVPSGWNLTSIACVDPTTNTTTNLAGATATVNVGAGETVVCTFTDVRAGSIRIVKQLRDDETAPFAFNVPTSLDPTGSFTLTPTVTDTFAARTFSNVPPGTYTVSEAAPPAGWMLLDLVCVDPSQDTVVNLGTRSATINLAAGESVECTFANTELSRITVSVVTSGGVGTFPFATTGLGANSFGLTTVAQDTKVSRSFGGLAPGSFSIDGLGATDWTLVDLQCIAVSGETYWTITPPHVGISIPHGEDIECTYYYLYNEPGPPPEAAPIPTLSAWGLALLTGTLLLFGGLAIRRRSS